MAAASTRLGASSLRRMWETCTLAVLTLMTSSSAISRLVRPRATSARTSASRGVRPSVRRRARRACGRRAAAPDRAAPARRAARARAAAGARRAGRRRRAPREAARPPRRAVRRRRRAPRPGASGSRRRAAGARGAPSASAASAHGSGRASAVGAVVLGLGEREPAAGVRGDRPRLRRRRGGRSARSALASVELDARRRRRRGGRGRARRARPARAALARTARRGSGRLVAGCARARPSRIGLVGVRPPALPQRELGDVHVVGTRRPGPRGAPWRAASRCAGRRRSRPRPSSSSAREHERHVREVGGDAAQRGGTEPVGLVPLADREQRLDPVRGEDGCCRCRSGATPRAPPRASCADSPGRPSIVSTSVRLT